MGSCVRRNDTDSTPGEDDPRPVMQRAEFSTELAHLARGLQLCPDVTAGQQSEPPVFPRQRTAVRRSLPCRHVSKVAVGGRKYGNDDAVLVVVGCFLDCFADCKLRHRKTPSWNLIR